MTDVTHHAEVMLVVTLQRFSDESLLGYLMRLSEANGYCSPRTIIKLLEQKTGQSVRLSTGFAADRKLIEALAACADAPSSSLAECVWHPIDSASGPYFDVRGAPIPLDALMTEHAQVCPLCLDEAGYQKEDWELSGVTVCPVHAVVLVDRCPVCHMFLQVMRSPLVTCSHCQFDLRLAPTVMATPKEVVLAEHIAALAPYLLKQGAENIVDHAESLFALGQTMSFDTKSVLDGDWKHRHFQRLPVEDRRKAWQSVVHALDGRAIDGQQLHQALLPHIAHRLPFLPRSLALKPLVDFVQGCHFLSPTARRLLSYGAEPSTRPTAAEYFGGRPPQLHQEGEVKTFLGCSDNAWTWLLKHGHIHLPVGELGFDADEILAARHVMEGFVSLSDMDMRFGVSNLTRCLIDWHVLPMATSPRDSWAAVDLTVVGQILDRLRMLSSAGLEVENEGWTRVCESPLAKVDLADAYSVLIARALRADVVGLRWSAPYSLQDLWVLQADAERLELPHPSRTAISGVRD